MKLAIKLLLLIFITSCTDDTSKIKIVPERKSYTELSYLAKQKSDNSVVLLLPMSGVHKSVGQNILNAVLLGNKNSNIDFYVIDTANCPDDLNQNSFRNLKAVIGPIFFQEIHKYATIFQNVPLFALSNNVNANDNHIFICGLSPQEEIKTIFKYIYKNNLDSIKIFLPKKEYFDNFAAMIQKESANLKIPEEEIEVIRYDSSVNLSDISNINKKTAIFLFEPIIDSEEMKKENVFTLSSIAISNPEKWEGAKFAYADNQDQRYFLEAYKKIFKESPNIISLAVCDIVKAINESLISEKSLFDENYNGTLGTFQIKKEKGIVRNLEIFKIENKEKIKIEDEE